MDNEEGWRRLAEAVRRRREQRDWTQLDVATRGPVSIDRIQAIEGVRTDRYSARTITKLERGLEWESGSIRAILAGGEPTPLEAARPSAIAQPEREPTVAELAAELAEVKRANAEMKRRIDRIEGREEGHQHRQAR